MRGRPQAHLLRVLFRSHHVRNHTPRWHQSTACHLLHLRGVFGASRHAALEHEEAERDDLLIATNTIQTLALLQTKTQGNLDEEEGKLLEAILAELRGKLPG